MQFHKYPSFINIINSKMNGIIGEKLVRPAIPCRVCVWPATRERLPIPELKSCMRQVNPGGLQVLAFAGRARVG